MTDEQIQELIAAYEFTGEDAVKVFRICREVASNTRHEFYSLIQHANNAAQSRTITARELDRCIWDTERSKRS